MILELGVKEIMSLELGKINKKHFVEKLRLNNFLK